MIIPIQINMQGEISVSNPAEVEALTLKDANVTEGALEEFVRKNVDKLFPEESLLIVGQQTRNQQAGRSDLVAVDGEGNIVLIELKRDPSDIVARKEPFEFQAIRYAANYALITTPQELEQKLFASYVEKHKSEPEYEKMLGMTSAQIAAKLLADFLTATQATNGFNRRQRIILVASVFDPQTLSACAWLVRNGIDISCVTISPVKYNQQYFFEIEQLIPPPQLEQYFVEVAIPSQGTTKASAGTSQGSKQSLPKMSQILAWGLITPGAEVFIRTKPLDVAEIVDGKSVKYQGQNLTYGAWGKQLTGWSAINVYEWTVDKKTAKTLDQLRREKLEQLVQAPVDTNSDGGDSNGNDMTLVTTLGAEVN